MMVKDASHSLRVFVRTVHHLQSVRIVAHFYTVFLLNRV